MKQVFTLVIAILTAMFFISGLDKFTNIGKVAQGLQQRVPDILSTAPPVFFTLAILTTAVLEVVAPLIMVYSAWTGEERRAASLSAIALSIFTVLATLLYHFPPFGKVYYPFVSNMTTIGGLLLASGVFYALDMVPSGLLKMAGF